jgi:hypothetical protein
LLGQFAIVASQILLDFQKVLAQIEEKVSGMSNDVNAFHVFVADCLKHFVDWLDLKNQNATGKKLEHVGPQLGWNTEIWTGEFGYFINSN